LSCVVLILLSTYLFLENQTFRFLADQNQRCFLAVLFLWNCSDSLTSLAASDLISSISAMISVLVVALIIGSARIATEAVLGYSLY